MNTTARTLHERAEKTPDALALRVEEREYTFLQLTEMADLLALKMWSHGWTEGPVAVWLPDGVEMVTAVWGIARAGGIFAPIHNRITAEEMANHLTRLGTNRLITLPERVGKLREAGFGLDVVTTEIAGSIDFEKERPTPLRAPEIGPTVHSILFTSGTTGIPKAVRLTWGNHWASAEAWCAFLGIGPADHYLGVIPQSHVGGLGILFRSVWMGFSVTCLTRFDAPNVNGLLDKGHINFISLVPTQLRRILQDRGGQPLSPSVREIIIGGAPLNEATAVLCADRRVPLVLSYGMTETASGIAAFRPREWPGRELSSGSPLGESVIRIVDARSGESVPAGVEGMIEVEGPTVMAGYLGDRSPGGRFRTEDRGRLDEEGFLYVSRIQYRRIISGGENVDALEVEQVLLAIPGIRDACVVGLPDDDLGERVVAVVACEADSPLSEEDLRLQCRTSLAPFKVPKVIRIWGELPLTASGKVRRRTVRARLLQENDEFDSQSGDLSAQ
ncbi:class I adenylate-forming enzyme family protein [Candidatus Neomarinimicrobiota bacterium]